MVGILGPIAAFLAGLHRHSHLTCLELSGCGFLNKRDLAASNGAAPCIQVLLKLHQGLGHVVIDSNIEWLVFNSLGLDGHRLV